MIDPLLSTLIAERGAPAPVRTLVKIRDGGNRVWLSQPARELADYVTGLDYRPSPDRRRPGSFVLTVKHGEDLLTIQTPADALIAHASEVGSAKASV